MIIIIITTLLINLSHNRRLSTESSVAIISYYLMTQDLKSIIRYIISNHSFKILCHQIIAYNYYLLLVN